VKLISWPGKNYGFLKVTIKKGQGGRISPGDEWLIVRWITILDIGVLFTLNHVCKEKPSSRGTEIVGRRHPEGRKQEVRLPKHHRAGREKEVTATREKAKDELDDNNHGV